MHDVYTFLRKHISTPTIFSDLSIHLMHKNTSRPEQQVFEFNSQFFKFGKDLLTLLPEMTGSAQTVIKYQCVAVNLQLSAQRKTAPYLSDRCVAE